jgi:thiamine-monophosphate kinase
MALSEFQLIQEFFTATSTRSDVVQGVGDDCALLQPPPGKELAVTVDTLVEGIHFLASDDPEAVGHKALAVNLSDLAAMGAEPAWVTLALSLPESDSSWLQQFSRGFLSLAERHGVQLVGGDTTQGPRSITVTAHGLIEPGRALRREAAQPGDLIYLTGTIGDAALALLTQSGSYRPQQGVEQLLQRLHRPTPRVQCGLSLAGIAHAAIDVSDGVLADLGHICIQSGVAAEINLHQIPLSSAVREYLEATGDWTTILNGGDDYELCFTLPPGREGDIADTGCELCCIGSIVPGSGIRCLQQNGEELSLPGGGYEHFRK